MFKVICTKQDFIVLFHFFFFFLYKYICDNMYLKYMQNVKFYYIFVYEGLVTGLCLIYNYV